MRDCGGSWAGRCRSRCCIIFYFLFFFPFTPHAMQVVHIQELRMRFHGSPLLWGPRDMQGQMSTVVFRSAWLPLGVSMHLAGHLWQIGEFLLLQETPRRVELGTAGTLIPNPNIVVVGLLLACLLDCLLHPSSFSSLPLSLPLLLANSCSLLFYTASVSFTFSTAFASVFVSITLFQLVCLDPTIHTHISCKTSPTPAAANPFPKQKQKQTES